MSSKPAGKPVSVKTHIATIESWEQDGYLAGEGLIIARVTISGHTTHVVLPEEFKDQGHFFIHKNYENKAN